MTARDYHKRCRALIAAIVAPEAAAALASAAAAAASAPIAALAPTVLATTAAALGSAALGSAHPSHLAPPYSATPDQRPPTTLIDHLCSQTAWVPSLQREVSLDLELGHTGSPRRLRFRCPLLALTRQGESTTAQPALPPAAAHAPSPPS